MKKATTRALAIKETGGQFFLHEAKGGEAVGEPVAGPFKDRMEADGARFKLMMGPVRKPAQAAPLRHLAPSVARSRVGV
jgi:hypothetical protein